MKFLTNLFWDYMAKKSKEGIILPMKTFIIDAGHGMSNREKGKFDPGVCFAGVRECDVALDWTNELRACLKALGWSVVRTRVDNEDPAPVGARAGIAKAYDGDLMVSFHVNSTPGAKGTETFYRGPKNANLASTINNSIVEILGTVNRGIKTEKDSQHSKLAIMSFDPCFLIEIGFIENADDRAKMTNPVIRKKACEALAKELDRWARMN